MLFDEMFLETNNNIPLSGVLCTVIFGSWSKIQS